MGESSMMPPAARLVLGVITIALMLALVFAFTSWRSPPTQPVTISLGCTGLSTNVATGVIAQFTVTNGNRWEIDYRVGVPQVKSNGVWQQAQITEGQMIRILPGKTANFLVVLPESPGVWRVPVVYCRPRSRAEMLFGRAWQKMASATGQPRASLGVTCGVLQSR